MGCVLVCPQCFRSKIFLSWCCRKPRQKWNSKGAHKQKVEKYDNDGGSKSDQKYRSKGDLKATKGSEWMENPSIYNKILS